MATALTSSAVAAALAGGRKGRYADFLDSRVKGLALRVRPTGSRWSVRGTLRGVQKRYDLGPATADSDDVAGLICLDSARMRGMEVRKKLREDRDPTMILRWMTHGAAGAEEDREAERKRLEREPERLRLIAEAEAEAARPTTWTWEQALLAYWEEKERANRPDTSRDYKTKLNAPEFTTRFSGRLVCEVTDVEIAEAYAQIFARAEAMGDGCLRTIKAFWTFLSAADRRSAARQSG